MAKRIVILFASPRANGNTRALADWFSEGARSAEADVELIDVARLSYKTNGCIACFGCQKSDRYGCVIDDEASPAIARLQDFDVLVIATPVYFFGPSAQLKLFLDRAYSLFKFDLQTGEVSHNLGRKAICLLATGGGRLEDGLTRTEEIYSTMAGFIGGAFRSLLVPRAPQEEGALKSSGKYREEAIALGKEMASG